MSNNGPKMEPWGTTLTTQTQLYLSQLTLLLITPYNPVKHFPSSEIKVGKWPIILITYRLIYSYKIYKKSVVHELSFVDPRNNPLAGGQASPDLHVDLLTKPQVITS